MDIEEYELICNARLNVFRFNEIESQTNLNVGYEGGGGVGVGIVGPLSIVIHNFVYFSYTIRLSTTDVRLH